MENYIWTMIMASWTPLIIHDSYELQTSMISDHSKWGFIRFTRSMITHDCYEHWLWAITVHRNSYEFGFWTINDQTHHTWWGGINAMKCWCSYMINTDSVSYYDPYFRRDQRVVPCLQRHEPFFPVIVMIIAHLAMNSKSNIISFETSGHANVSPLLKVPTGVIPHFLSEFSSLQPPPTSIQLNIGDLISVLICNS